MALSDVNLSSEVAEGRGFEPRGALRLQRFSRPPSLPPELTGLGRYSPFLISTWPLDSLTIPAPFGPFRVHWHQECTKISIRSLRSTGTLAQLPTADVDPSQTRDGLVTSSQPQGVLRFRVVSQLSPKSGLAQGATHG